MNNGYWQRLLRVDLTNRTTHVQQIEQRDLRQFIGGAGLAAEILRRELPARLDAYDRRNRLIFATGPFQGPAVPGGAKFSVVASRPLRTPSATRRPGQAGGRH